MSGLCGWLGGGAGESGSRRLIEHMASHLARFNDGERLVAANGPGALACTGARDIDTCNEDGLLVGISGHIKLRSAEALAMARDSGVAKALASTYRKHGTGLFDLIEGAFALAIIDTRANEALLAIDRSGICPLSYTVAGRALVFSSSADAINLYPSIKGGIEAQSIYNYLYFHMIPAPGTIFSGQRRLLPGQYLLFRNGEAVTKSYWAKAYDRLQTASKPGRFSAEEPTVPRSRACSER